MKEDKRKKIWEWGTEETYMMLKVWCKMWADRSNNLDGNMEEKNAAQYTSQRYVKRWKLQNILQE